MIIEWTFGTQPLQRFLGTRYVHQVLVAAAIVEVLTSPLVIFMAPARPQAVTSTIDITTFTAPARHQAVTSASRGGG